MRGRRSEVSGRSNGLHSPRAVLALLALCASGCERSTLTLTLGLDREDNLAREWLGYYPTRFEPVGACPNQNASEAQAVKGELTDEAIGKLKKVFAVEISAGDALRFTGQKPPQLDPASQKAMEAEGQLALAARALQEQEALMMPGLDQKVAAHALEVARKAAAEARAYIAPTLKPYLVRGVSFSATKAPTVTVCYGDVQVSDHVMGSTVPKMYPFPLVVWVGTPVRRGQVSAGVTK
jgi:uncharacterized membrane protein